MENSALLLNKFPLLSIYLMSLSRTTFSIGILKKSIVTYKFTLMIYFSIFRFVGLMVWPVIYLHPDQDGKLSFMMLSAKWWCSSKYAKPCILHVSKDDSCLHSRAIK